MHWPDAAVVLAGFNDDAAKAAAQKVVSVGALTGNPVIASYVASKHGVIGLTRTAALEYIKKASTGMQ